MSGRASLLLTSALLAVVVTLSGCNLGSAEDRFVRPGSPRTSPTGGFTAEIQNGPERDGAPSWVVVVRDSAGGEVFRDDFAYSIRHRIGVTWRSDRDQLWIVSTEAGTHYVQQGAGQRWDKRAVTQDTRDQVPEEIAKLR
jgi:hypothetical protein